MPWLSNKYVKVLCNPSKPWTSSHQKDAAVPKALPTHPRAQKLKDPWLGRA